MADPLAVYPRLAAASVRAITRRPAYLAVRTAAAALIVAIEVAGVMLMLDRFGTIGGWRPAEVVLLFGLAFTAQGIAMVFGNSLEADKVSELVRRGTFDQVLTRPASPLGWVVASYLDVRFVGRLLAGAATVAWAADQAGVAWTPGRVGLAVLAVACAAAIIFGVLLAAAGFTFVTVQGSEAVNVLVYGGTYLASYPMQIYGSALRFLFTWLVPGRPGHLRARPRGAGPRGPARAAGMAGLAGRPGRRGLPGRRRLGLAGRDPPLRGDRVMSHPLIEVEGLRKVFRTRRGPVEAVAGIDFRMQAGEFVGYAGPNGAGKSTTVKMMSGILLPSGGRVEVCGMVPYRERKRLARRMGVVFGQRTQLWWDLPLEESFELVGHLYRIPRADRAARLRRLEEVLALGPLLGVPVRSLSLGQRMRAELAAAVLPAPEVLFLDEPTIGLDVEAKAAVRDFLRELNRSEGTTVILTTHDLDDITRLCSRLLIIDHGRLIYDGTVEALRTAYGTTRVLVVDLAEDEPAEVAGAVLTRAEGRRRWFQFARDEVSAAELIARLLAGHEVADLTLEEPDIEDIVRRIYRGETPPGGPGG